MSGAHAGRRRRPGWVPSITLALPVLVGATLLVIGLVPGRGPQGPASSMPSPDVAAATGSTTPSQTTPAPAVFVFPVIGPVSYHRTHHDYPATDILAKCGSPVVAVTGGMILDTSPVDIYDARIDNGSTRGGLSVSILGDDGVRYYGSHLSRIEGGIKPGVRVTVGQRLGDVGATGNASACHLHFGISPPCARIGDWRAQRGVIWPWPYLDAWRLRTNKSAAPEVAVWHAAHGCPAGP